MNPEWSEKNKTMQSLLKKTTLPQGIAALLELRETLFRELLTWKDTLTPEDFCAIPFLNADGYHSKTVAYSLWHIFRIEDIVVHSLISREEQVFFSGGFVEKIHPPILTTGNELVGEQIAEFSRALDLDGLYAYIRAVKDSTDAWLPTITGADLKRTFTDADRAYLAAQNCVSTDENAVWLLDYWCSRDLAGLIRMPLARHWIMHLEASLRIIRKIGK